MNRRYSVAIASYNGAKYLEEQLDSIFNQTIPPGEVVVCDDQSTDSTVEILKKFSDKYNLVYVVNDERLGFVKNFEKAVSNCKLDYIALSDQDDIWFSNKMEVLLNKMEEIELIHPQIPVLVHSDSTIIDNNLNVISPYFIGNNGEKIGFKNLLFSNSKLQGASCIFNKRLKDIVFPFPPNVPLHDFYMSLVIEACGIRFFVKESLMYYRIHPQNTLGVVNSSIFTKISRMFKNSFRVVDQTEYDCLIAFSQKFVSNNNIISDYFAILRSKNIFKKVYLVLKNGFNTHGSVSKLILKLLIKRNVLLS